MEGVSRKQQYNKAYTIDFGNIIIPEGQDREDFINTCYRKERVTILGLSGAGVYTNCPIIKEALGNISFPSDTNTLGSLVVFASHPFHNKPVIIGTISKLAESQLLSEGGWKIGKVSGESSANITGNASEGVININIDSETTANLNINVVGENGSKVKIQCQTEAEIYSDEKISIRTTGEVDITAINPSAEGEESKLSITPTEINIVPSERVNLFQGEEPLVLGNKLKSELEILQEQKVDIIISALENSPIVATDGGAAYKAGIVAALQVAQDADFSEINSEKSFTD